MTWKVGDRVSVDPTARGDWTSGTVTAVDEEGLPRGVRVRLDRAVSGCDYCYASHDELKARPSGICCILKDQAGINGTS